MFQREIGVVKDEIAMTDRREIDANIFDAIGLTQGEQDAVYEAIINLVEVRLKKASSLDPKDRQKRSEMGNDAED